jgi:hypothetical protein
MSGNIYVCGVEIDEILDELMPLLFKLNWEKVYGS